jgi:hypothetical protein
MGFDSFGDFTLESFAVLPAGFERTSTGTRLGTFGRPSRVDVDSLSHRIQVVEGDSRPDTRAGVPAEPTLVAYPADRKLLLFKD